jgi:hypothetical protein
MQSSTRPNPASTGLLRVPALAEDSDASPTEPSQPTARKLATRLRYLQTALHIGVTHIQYIGLLPVLDKNARSRGRSCLPACVFLLQNYRSDVYLILYSDKHKMSWGKILWRIDPFLGNGSIKPSRGDRFLVNTFQRISNNRGYPLLGNGRVFCAVVRPENI